MRRATSTSPTRTTTPSDWLPPPVRSPRPLATAPEDTRATSGWRPPRNWPTPRASRHDHAGASHVLEHLLFKGTAERSPSAIAEAVDEVGGDFNAFTTKEYTSFYIRLLAEHLPLDRKSVV